jgi:hypothetical protein
MSGWYFKVLFESPAPTMPCECDDTACCWSGPFSDLVDIGGCSLSPGNIIPAGRCHRCDALAFVTEKP